jgi:hypothetical protein
MLNIFSNKQKGVYDILLFTTPFKQKPHIIKSDYEINENTRYYPFASKEWSTNIYSYNKSYTKSLISLNAILNKLVKSYCNILQNKIKILFKRRRANKMRYSADKVYISGIELSHTNSNIFITLSLFNKRKYSIEQSIRKAITLIQYHKIRGVNNKVIYIANHKNRLLHFFKNNFCISKKWNIAFFKPIGNVVKYFTVNIGKKHLESHNILTNNIKLLNKFITSQINLFTSTKEINFSISKYNTLYIKWKGLGLISLIEKLFNKKVEIELIELKNIHLNSAVFSSAVALKLRDRKNKAVRILRKAILQMVRIPDLHTLITFDDNIEEMNKNNIINTIKQQIVTGVRLEASGRLTRRLTAMRAVFKYRYAGSLKNIRSSFNNKSSTMLRGYVKSNSQYTLINSKTRNGTFGLKGWVSSHSGIIEKLHLSPCNHYLGFVEDKAIFGYPWDVPQLFSDYLCLFKDKCAPGLEWALHNPPKPHAFISLPLTSGLDKGKGRAKSSPEVEKIPSPYPETDSEDERNIRRALEASLKPPKIGEPSTSKVTQKETSPESTYNHSDAEAKVQLYKDCNDEFLRYSRLHFNLKISLVKEPTTKEKDSLCYYLEKANYFKQKKTTVEQELMKQGIEPSAQFSSKSSSLRGSSSEYESESSQDRSKKRVKYSNDKNIDSSLGFILFNITPVLRLLSCVFSAIFFLMCLILPDLDLSFVKIDLSQLLFTYLMFSVTKLIYKSYRVATTLYNHFLNKDYMIIYFNVYFSIVTILLCFSENSGIFTI